MEIRPDAQFQVSDLTEEDLGQWEYMLNSPVYQNYIYPFLESRRQAYIQLALAVDPETRRKAGGTKYLRAGANNLGLLLSFFNTIVKETQHDRAARAREAMSDQDKYQRAVQDGIIRGSGQGLTPEEDF